MKILSLFILVLTMTKSANAFMGVSEKEIIATGISSYYLQVSHSSDLDYISNQGAMFRAKTEAMSDALKVAKSNCLEGTLSNYKEVDTPIDNIRDGSFPEVNIHYTIQVKCLMMIFGHS